MRPEDERGYILGLVLIFFVIFTILGLSFVQMSGYERLYASKHEDNMRAFYYADAGLQRGLWLINKVSKEAASFEDSTVTVVYDTTTNELISTGYSGGATYTLKVIVEQDNPFNHIVSYQTNLLLGDNATVSHIDGAEIIQTNHFPVPDMDYYQSIADTVIDLDGTGEVKFNGDTLYGIVFVNGKVRVQNDTVIYGTLAATNDIKFAGDSEIYSQQVPGSDPPQYYPAVIASGAEQVEVEGTPTQQVYGAIYSSGQVIQIGGQWTGPVVADDVDIRNNSTLSDNGEATYYGQPPGFEYPSGSSGDYQIKSGSWQKL